MQDEFVEIGERLGPFDLTLIEIGACDRLWPDVHLGPEQAVRAHRLVRGDVLLPVHWGTFDLALHGWTEPIERTLAAAVAHAAVADGRRSARVVDARCALRALAHAVTAAPGPPRARCAPATCRTPARRLR